MHTSTDPAAVPMTALGQSNATRRIQSLVDSCTTLGRSPPCVHLVSIARVARSVCSRRTRANSLSRLGVGSPVASFSDLDVSRPPLFSSRAGGSGEAPSSREEALMGTGARRDARAWIRRDARGHS